MIQVIKVTQVVQVVWVVQEVRVARTTSLDDMHSEKIWFSMSLNILGRTVFDFFKFKHSLASYKPVHAVVASVLVSTLSTTSLAALSSFLSSRSTCSTILP